MVTEFLILAGVIFMTLVIRGIIRYKISSGKKSNNLVEKRIHITELGLHALSQRNDRNAKVILMPKESDILQFIRGNYHYEPGVDSQVLVTEGITLWELAEGFKYLPDHAAAMSEIVQYLLQKKFIEIK